MNYTPNNAKKVYEDLGDQKTVAWLKAQLQHYPDQLSLVLEVEGKQRPLYLASIDKSEGCVILHALDTNSFRERVVAILGGPPYFEKVKAIHWVRSKTGMHLRDAKQYVESVMQSLS